MPWLSEFCGILISMYWNEANHQTPHFHAEYGDFESSIALDGTEISGDLPARQLRLVQRWAAYIRTSCGSAGNAPADTSAWSGSIRWPNLCAVDEVNLPLVRMTGVAVIGAHKLRLLFADGTVGDVSFADYDWPGVFAPLRDPAQFAKVTVAHGTLYWAEDELDWAPEPLYQAAKSHALAPVAAAA